MKTNYERFNSVSDARWFYEKYRAVETEAIANDPLCAKANPIDEFDWLFKSADTALVLEPGQVVQVMENIRGEGRSPKYAVVERLRPINLYGQVRVHEVDLRLPDGTTLERYDVPECVHSAYEEIRNRGDMKIADFPADLISLALNKTCRCGFDMAVGPLKEKCPFRDEYKEPVPPCMKEETHE